MGRSRGGWTSKCHLLCDGRGHALNVVISQGQRHDNQFFDALLSLVRLAGVVGRSRTKPDALTGDNAYSCKRIRHECHRRDITPVLPENKQQKANRSRKPGQKPTLDREKYRRRNIVERLIGWLKHNRRIATRYEKLSESYRAFILLAIIRRFLREL